MKQSALHAFKFNGIAQADCVKILMNMIDLCDTAGIYVVDRDQKVLLWDEQMVQLSGIRYAEAIGRECLQDLTISEFSEDKEERIKLPRVDGNAVEVTKYTQVLHQQNGIFAGGFGLLRINISQDEAHTLAATTAQAQLNFHGILSRSPTMRPVFQLIENAAETEVTVVVRGESGSGKELVAKAIHDLSPRSNAPFLAINCAALSSNLLESELFGHVRGAFTGAIKDHSGLFQRADGGTLFLDEVAELPLELQAKLLRVLQERNFIPVGGTQAVDVNVRIVAATHRSLREEVKKGRFREDLMYRLRVVPIFIPPLRERREDINLLLWHFIRQHNVKKFRRIEKIDPQAMRVLMDYQWPGNIRELQNVVEYAFVVGQDSVMHLADLPPEFRKIPAITELSQKKITMSVEDEAEAIRQALQQSKGMISPAAQLLGMSRATFWRKRKFYGI
jgi:two-component system, NtrC family, response regulator AtoC